MIWRLLAASFFLVAASFAGAAGFWVTERTPPAYIMAAEVITNPVKPGGDLRISYSVERRESCFVQVDRVMFDSTNTMFVLADADYHGAVGPMGYDTVRVNYRVPLDMAAGRARLRVIAAYRCNPIHWLWPVVRTTDTPFDVAK